MKTFEIRLLGSAGQEVVKDVVSFVGQDESGSFGLLAGHARLIAVLVYGLAGFRQEGEWRYIALPGGVLRFSGNVLTIVTRRHFIDTRYDEISSRLLDQLVAEEGQLAAMKRHIAKLEQEMLRTLWKMEREG